MSAERDDGQQWDPPSITSIPVGDIEALTAELYREQAERWHHAAQARRAARVVESSGQNSSAADSD